MTSTKRQTIVTPPPAGAALDAGGAGSLSLTSKFDADANANGQTGGFDSYTLADLEAYETPTNHILAGNGIIRRGAGTLMAGGTGVGKSVAVGNIAVQLSGGVPMLDCIRVLHPVRVLYLQAENDPDTMKRDFMAAVKHSKAKRDTVQRNLRIKHVWGAYGEAFNNLFRRFVDEHNPDVAIVDPYQTFVNPGDLNGTAAFLEWIAPIQPIIKERNMALIVVAHTPKPKDRSDWNAREMVYSAAGSSAISNWARTSMELTTAKHEVDRFRLTFGKNAERNGLIDGEGHVVREIFMKHSGSISEPYWTVADSQAAPSASKYAEDIMSLAIEHPSMSYREIAKAVGCSTGTVSAYYPKDAS